MDCPEAKKKVDRYLCGELRPDVADEVEEHLEACADCRSALERARGLEEAFDRAVTPPVPEGFEEGLRHRARRRIPGALPAWRGLSAPWRAAVAASLLVGLALGFLMASGGRGMGASTGAQRDPTEVASAQGLDYFSESPPGSINRAYVGALADRERRD